MALDTSYLRFKSVNHFGDSHITDRLETSLVYFLNWAFLEIGAFFNVEIPTSGAFGGDFSKLRAVKDPAFTNYTVYETPRQDIIWESGLTYASGTPIPISGVYINNTFYEPTDPVKGHYIDYARGRVVFENALTSSSTVKMNYSYKWVSVISAGDAPWWRELQYGSFRVDDTTFTQLGSGNWSMGAQHRVQMPCVIVESVPTRSFTPYELGSAGNWVYQYVNFDIFAESKYERDKIMDLLSSQCDRGVYIFNPDEISFPLDYKGALTENAKCYPEFVKPRSEGGARWVPAHWRNVQIVAIDTPHPNLFTARVKVIFQFPFGDT